MIDVTKTISELDPDHGTYSSTYSSVIAFRAADLPQWLKICSVKLFPDYSVGQLLAWGDTRIILRRYRRQSSRYTMHIFNPMYMNVCFLFRGYVPLEHTTFASIFSHLIDKCYLSRRRIHAPTDATSIISELLISYPREYLAKCLSVPFPKISAIDDELRRLYSLGHTKGAIRAALGETDAEKFIRMSENYTPIKHAPTQVAEPMPVGHDLERYSTLDLLLEVEARYKKLLDADDIVTKAQPEVIKEKVA